MSTNVSKGVATAPISPEPTFIDWTTGTLSGPGIEEGVKTLGQLEGLFRDQGAWRKMAPATEVYRVRYWRPVPDGTLGGVFWGATVLQPGRVGDEYFMTHGHFHANRDRAEIYATVKGTGAMLFMDEAGKTWSQTMKPGTVHYIPGNVAHRVVNTGNEPLTFLASWPSDAGHDYGSIRTAGFGKRMILKDGEPCPGLTALAVDLGGSHATCALVRDGGIVASKIIPAEGGKGLGGLLPAINEALFGLMREAKVDRTECSAVVMGFPGIANARENRVLATNAKFDDAPNLDLTGWFKSAFGLPFLIENDARLALLGEAAYGAARGAEDAVMITLGTGIGGAAMLGGRLVQSKHGLAGTIGGHLPLNMSGRRCTCGNIGCAESEGSTFFLPVVYGEKAGEGGGMLSKREAIGFADLFAAVEAGDKPAIAALEHCMRAWAVLTVGLIHMYDPEVVVIGGAVMKREAEILPKLQQYVKEHAWTPNRTVPLRTAELGSNAALLGALPLVEYSL